jgi:hypothetical protein
MWSFQTKRNALHEQLLLAPESNPSEFVRRYLAQKEKSARFAEPGSRIDGAAPNLGRRPTQTRDLLAG